MCSWWDSNGTSLTNPLIKYWTGIRDVTVYMGRQYGMRRRALLEWGKGDKRKRPKGRISQMQCPHFPFPNCEWPSYVELPTHTYWLAVHSLLPQRWPRGPAIALRASLHRAPGDPGVRATERKWPWEMPRQSMPKSTKLWKPKVVCITHLIAKGDYTNVKLFTISSIPLTIMYLITLCWL